VTNFGMFVECVDPFVEGLVKLDQLGDDYFQLDEKHMRLSGRRTGKTYALGDPVRVRVDNVSVARRRIDFSVVLPEGEARAPRAAGDGKPKRGERREQKQRDRQRGDGKRRRRS